jgi:U4/U6.U5 tri-snRNP-associated protein 1
MPFSSSSSSAQVIELSVEETNALRAQLGLPPLRGAGGAGAAVTQVSDSRSVPSAPRDVNGGGSGGEDTAVLEMSVDESNALRQSLGLPPLRVGNSGRAAEQHAPAVNVGDQKAAQERVERAQLKRQVEQGIKERFASETLAGNSADDAVSWAKQMRRQAKQKQQQAQPEPGNGGATAAAGAKGASSSATNNNRSSSYSSDEMKDLAVAHRASDFEHGSTVTLTLQDESLLETDVHHKVVGLRDEQEGEAAAGAVLENVNLADAQRTRDGLHAKRLLEMGAGRAGAYAGFDDDEFAELGGTQAPARTTRGHAATNTDPEKEKKKKNGRGAITIGSLLHGDGQEDEEESDLFAMRKGKAISLEPSRADLVASDFMTMDEDQATRKEKKSKKNAKFHKKDKKASKKRKSKHRHHDDDDDDDDDNEGDNATSLRLAKLRSKGAAKGLLEELEETAVDSSSAGARKRRRRDSDGDEMMDETDEGPGRVTSARDDEQPQVDKLDVAKSESTIEESRAKFDAIMAKGNERTLLAFSAKSKKGSADVGLDDEEPDDAFLNAALTKARRFNRLKELAVSSTSTSAAPPPAVSAAEAVAAAVLSSSAVPDVATSQGGDGNGTGGGGTVDFVVDETREFTRALQARLEQQQRDAAKRKPTAMVIATNDSKGTISAGDANAGADLDDKGAAGDEDADMAELAKDIQPDEGLDAASSAALDGTTGAAVQLGRGLGGVLGLLQQTGELTRKNAGREELRGRAKDERPYEYYEPLDLSQVVKIDERTATDKDREFARRQIKLEYRDEHGRLVTPKEAFRNLSKDFHGYGSGKRKTAKKLAEIAREQAETRHSQQLGSLAALQKTTKATGKAYVVHKT